MKIIRFILASLLCLSFSCWGQELTEPVRNISGRVADLNPLFNWWTNAIAIAETNKHLPKRKRLEIPERPMKHWVRVISLAVTNNGFAHIGTITIQHVPDGPRSNLVAVLRAGPFEQKKNVDVAAQRFKQVSKEAESQRGWASFHEQRANNLDSRSSQYQEIRNAGGGKAFQNLSGDYRNASRRADQAAQAAAQRAGNLEAEQKRLAAITKGADQFRIDDWAMATGEIYAGLPVYSFGMPFGR